MTGDSGTTVFLILVPLFLAVGLYLLWYNRRRGRMLAAFAEEHGFRIDSHPSSELEAALNSRFSLQDRGLARGFTRVASPVDTGEVCIFRVTELLDLNPHARTQSTHFARICALFEADPAHSAFFLLSAAGSISSRVPGAPPPDPRVADRVRRAVAGHPLRHTLSVTFAGGTGLIYFEPLVTGGETGADLEALYGVALALREGPRRSLRLDPAPSSGNQSTSASSISQL